MSLLCCNMKKILSKARWEQVGIQDDFGHR
ncbi:MAG: hypothetical protein QG635_2119 [Bacteroidota bacterium]|nr:hypothetical protein [Bacteroidota bacterium]